MATLRVVAIIGRDETTHEGLSIESFVGRVRARGLAPAAHSI